MHFTISKERIERGGANPVDAMLYIVKRGDPARVDAISLYKENDS